jgi:hypothetical protein|tara:strand:- start:322 stop:603 length:282 start_codon:yes stop_codon:yes gene_type:complete
MPKKNVTLKTGLTRDEIVELLNLYQIMDDILQDASEIFDIDLSKLRRLRDGSHVLKQMFDFRPRIGEDGNPNHWQNYVMPDDERAWYHTPKED